MNKPTARRRGFAQSIESALVSAVRRSLSDVEAVLSSALRMIPKSALSAGLEVACAIGKPAIVDRLITAGAKNRNDALTAACNAGQVGTADRMIRNGATNRNGNLSVACRRGDLPIVELLTNCGADMNRGLNAASAAGSVAIVEFLLSKTGGNHTSAVYGAVYYACIGGHLSVIKLLISAGGVGNYDALRTACCCGNLAIVDYLSVNGYRNYNDGLATACQYDHINVAARMIANGADNQNVVLQSMVFSFRGLNRLNAISLLIGNGANNAASVFDGVRDRQLLLDLLETTRIRRTALVDVPHIQSIFDDVDRTVAAIRNDLTAIGWPRVLQTIVLEYVVGLD